MPCPSFIVKAEGGVIAGFFANAWRQLCRQALNIGRSWLSLLAVLFKFPGIFTLLQRFAQNVTKNGTAIR